MTTIKQIIAMIIAFFQSVLGLAPAVQPADTYTQAEWYALVADEFNLTYDLEDGDNYGDGTVVDEAAEACYDWNVLVGEYDADAAITNVIVAGSLVRAAQLEDENGDTVADANDGAALKIAVDAGLVSVSYVFSQPREKVVSKDVANVSLKTAGALYLEGLKDNENGGTAAITGQGQVELSSLSLAESADGYTLQTADGKTIDEEDITALDYEGSVNPFAQPEIAGINNQSILDDISVDFSIGGLDVYAGLEDGGVDFELSGDINGVNVRKAWQLRDFNIDAKFEGNLSVNDIKRSYVILDYKLTDITEASTSKAWSLAESELPEGTDDVDFFARVQNNLFEMKEGGDSEITVFNVDIAIPNCPAITIGLTAKLIVTFDGRVELQLCSAETKGVEIVDNKVRLIDETEAISSHFEAEARVEAKLGLYVDVSIVSIVLIDAGVELGIGIHVTVTVDSGASKYTLNIPCEFINDYIDASALGKVDVVIPNIENLKGHVDGNIYGIVSVSVGENSAILDKLGLSKTWNFVTEDNGTFYHFERDFDLSAVTAA